MNSLFASLTRFRLSLGHAWRGLGAAFGGRHMRFHGLATLVVLGAGAFFQLPRLEWLLLILLISVVWIAEILNSALEELANVVRDELKLDYAATRLPRDLAAGAVLVAAIGAAVGGALIFLPKLLAW